MKSENENSPQLWDIRSRAADWADFMNITTPFTVQYGSFDGLPEEAKATGDEFGATFGSPDNSQFIVCISDKCPPEKLDQVIVHELVHVHTFAQSGPDDRAAMEVATELAAQLVIQLREAEDAA